MVSGLVEEQQVRLLQQELAECNTTLLSTRELVNGPVSGGTAQGVHGLCKLRIKVPAVCCVNVFLKGAHLSEKSVKVCIGLSHGGRDLVETIDLAHDFANAVLHVLQNSLGLIEYRLLHQDAHRVSSAELGFTVRRGVESRHDLQNGRLTSTVGPYDTNLGAREERHCDVIENELVAHCLAGTNHGINELSHGSILGVSPGSELPFQEDIHLWPKPATLVR